MKMVIGVEGGAIQSIECDQDFDVIVFDLDTDRVDEEFLGFTLDGRKALVTRIKGRSCSHAEEAFQQGLEEIARI